MVQGRVPGQARMIARLGTPGDLPQLMRLLVEMHQEAPAYLDQPFDFAKVQTLAQAGCNRTDPRLLLVVADAGDGQLIGFAALMRVESMFGPAVEWHDLSSFVTPARRGSSAAMRMFNLVHQVIGQLGGGRVKIGVTTGVDDKVIARFFEKLGYRPAGYLLCADIPATVH